MGGIVDYNPGITGVFIVGVLLIIGFFIFIYRMKIKGKFDTMAPNGAGKSGHSSLRQMARSAGLNKDQTKMLAFVLKNDRVTNPEEPFNSPELLDRHFRNAYLTLAETSSGTAKAAAAAQERLTLFFSTRNILEARDSGTGGETSQKKPPSQRMFRRRQAALPADIHLVRLEDTGNKKGKLMVDKEKLTGKIMDISIGGCGIQTTSSIPSAARLKIEFSPTAALKAVTLGQVLRTNQSGTSTVMHIKFLKVPRKTMNAINALVFEYSER